jgi:hypothetical protein
VKRHDFVPPTLKQSPNFAHARRRLFPLSTRQSKTVGDHCTIADIGCWGRMVFMSEGGFEIANWPHLEAWARRLKAMPGFALPYDLRSRLFRRAPRSAPRSAVSGSSSASSASARLAFTDRFFRYLIVRFARQYGPIE